MDQNMFVSYNGSLLVCHFERPAVLLVAVTNNKTKTKTGKALWPAQLSIWGQMLGNKCFSGMGFNISTKLKTPHLSIAALTEIRLEYKNVLIPYCRFKITIKTIRSITRIHLLLLLF